MSMTPGTLVALNRPIRTVRGGFEAGSVLEVAGRYPDQGRQGGDFLSLRDPGQQKVVLQGIRPVEVRLVREPRVRPCPSVSVPRKEEPCPLSSTSPCTCA
jgi:hypothetical protein